jgi:hypothetical protein
VSPARLTRFFVKEPGGYRVKKEIRAMVVFAPQNLIMDPPLYQINAAGFLEATIKKRGFSVRYMGRIPYVSSYLNRVP